MAKKNKKNNNKAVGVGIAIAGIAAAAAAGAYYLSTPEGKKKRKEIRGWMLKAKGEVMERLEDVKEINKETYEKIVDEVVGGYKKLKQVDAKELGMLALELKSQWEDIKTEAKRDIATAKSAKKRIVKRAKKVSKPKKKSSTKKKS
jgi:hypothetical protein